jgi:hypothetical protein
MVNFKGFLEGHGEIRDDGVEVIWEWLNQFLVKGSNNA